MSEISRSSGRPWQQAARVVPVAHRLAPGLQVGRAMHRPSSGSEAGQADAGGAVGVVEHDLGVVEERGADHAVGLQGLRA
jgi:hypothetical protein